MHKDISKGKESIKNSSSLYQTYRSTVILTHKPKVIHLQPQTLQGESVAKPITPLLIICSIVYKPNMLSLPINMTILNITPYPSQLVKMFNENSLK